MRDISRTDKRQCKLRLQSPHRGIIHRAQRIATHGRYVCRSAIDARCTVRPFLSRLFLSRMARYYISSEYRSATRKEIRARHFVNGRRNLASPSRRKHVQTATAAAFLFLFFFRQSTRIFQISAYTSAAGCRGHTIMRDFWLVARTAPWAQCEIAGVRCPPRPISIMRRNVAADTTARAEEEKKKIASIVLSRLRRRLSLFFHLFISASRIGIGTSTRPRAIFHATIRSYCGDYWTFLSVTADLNQRIFQRDARRITRVFVRVRAQCQEQPFVQRRLNARQYCTRYCCAAAHFTFPHFLHFTHA